MARPLITAAQFQHCAFNMAWEQCARDGDCDALYSAQYVRVFAQWLKQAQPVDIRQFIRDSDFADGLGMGYNLEPRVGPFDTKGD